MFLDLTHGLLPRVQKFNDLQALRMSQSLDYMRSLLEEFYRKRIIHI
jgi:hypothetical protein